MSELNEKHHTMIQSLISRGPLKDTDFFQIFAGVIGKNPGQKLFNDYLLKINKELAYVQFELRCCRNQYDGNIYYSVVNNVADDEAKLGTKYSVPQIAFYKAVIEAIVQDPTAGGSISNTEALNVRLENQAVAGIGSQSQAESSNVPAAFRNFSISQKDKTLDELIRDRWLYSPSDGRIGLGVRSFFDLRSWFRLNDVPSCEICNEAGVKAELCENENCAVRIHSYCLKKKFSQRKVEKVCPGCGSQWSFPGSGTQGSEEEEDDELITQSVAAPSTGSVMRKKRRTCKTEKLDATAQGTCSQAVPNLRRTTRRSTRLN